MPRAVAETEIARQRQQILSWGLQPDDPDLKNKIAALFAARSNAILTSIRSTPGFVATPLNALPAQAVVDQREAAIALSVSRNQALMAVSARAAVLASSNRIASLAAPVFHKKPIPNTGVHMAPVQPTLTLVLINGQIVPSNQQLMVSAGDTMEFRGTNFLGGNENIQPTLTLTWAPPLGGYPTPPSVNVPIDYISQDQTDLIFVVPANYLDQIQEGATLTLQVGQGAVSANITYNAPSQTDTFLASIMYPRISDVTQSGNNSSHLCGAGCLNGYTGRFLFTEGANATTIFPNSERYTIYPSWLGGQGDTFFDTFTMPVPSPGTGAHWISITYIQNPGDSSDISPAQNPGEAYAFLSAIPVSPFNGGWAPLQGGVLFNQSYAQITSINSPAGTIWAVWGFSAQNGIGYTLAYSIVVPTHPPHATVFQGPVPGF